MSFSGWVLLLLGQMPMADCIPGLWPLLIQSIQSWKKPPLGSLRKAPLASCNQTPKLLHHVMGPRSQMVGLKLVPQVKLWNLCATSNNIHSSTQSVVQFFPQWECCDLHSDFFFWPPQKVKIHWNQMMCKSSEAVWRFWMDIQKSISVYFFEKLSIQCVLRKPSCTWCCHIDRDLELYCW